MRKSSRQMCKETMLSVCTVFWGPIYVYKGGVQLLTFDNRRASFLASMLMVKQAVTSRRVASGAWVKELMIGFSVIQGVIERVKFHFGK